MVCTIFSELVTFADWLVWPTSCNYYLYLWVLGALWVTVVLILYNTGREKLVQEDVISCAGVTSIAIVVLAGIMTLIQDSSGIPMLQDDLFLYVFSFCVVWILIWSFKK